jgi:paraquat-inducible protein A
MGESVAPRDVELLGFASSSNLDARNASVTRCLDCDAAQIVKPIRTGRLQCWRCAATLEQATGRSVDAALACSLATFLLLIPANSLPLLKLEYPGIVSSTRPISGVELFWHEGFVLVAIVVALQVIAFPLLRFGILSACLILIRLDYRRHKLGPFFRWAEKIDLWAMPDVFLISCAIGYSRIEAYASVTIGEGGWCMIAAAFMAMMTRAAIDRRSIWRQIGAPSVESSGADVITCWGCNLLVPASDEGQRCPRCRERVWRRKPCAVNYAIALTAAGFILYPIANIYPMSMFNSRLVHTTHTIFAGVMDLINAGLWPLACLVFTASIAIPFLKLAGMTWFVISVSQRSRSRLVLKTRFYRFIDEIGRWSNMDVYTIMVFAPMVQLGPLASFHAGLGMPAFLAVIVVTMFASETFDPRLMWDAAGVSV